jgi:hypothetical protein
MQTNIEKKVYYLQAYCVAVTLLVGSVFVMGFADGPKQKFQELDVERINVVDKNGGLKMVIANKERQHSGASDGIDDEPRERAQGMIFFNDKGDEVGGLIFGGDGVADQNVHLSFDKGKNDQTITLDHAESNGNYFAGMKVADRPNINLRETMAKVKEIENITDEAKRNAKLTEMKEKGEFGANRIIVGRGFSKDSVVSLADGKGRPRLSMVVSEKGEAKIEFLDENGKVTSSFPQTPAAKKKK